MNTLKLNKNVQMIAHRGVSGLECENTVAAFVAAGNRSYYGIETDVHRTADGRYVTIHDETTGRVAKEDYCVEKTRFTDLRSIRLMDVGCAGIRGDLMIPTLEEYISVCKKYEKKAILELKCPMLEEHVLEIADIIKGMDYLEDTVFISFFIDNLIALKKEYPLQTAQYLVGEIKNKEEMIDTLKKYNLDIDAHYLSITEELVNTFHENGIKVNVWTVDSLNDAERLVEMGVDYITSNILE